MEFGLLGPLEVRHHGDVVAVRAGRPRAVLIALLLRPGRPVGSDQLIDDVWHESPPADSSNALQVQVSYLRRALPFPGDGLPALRTVRGGYRLDVDPDHIDVHRFEHLLVSAAARLSAPATVADVDDALADLRRAAGLWRGDPLHDVAFEPFAADEISRLEELRVVADERTFDALLLLGRHREAIVPLRQLVRRHPGHEHLRAQLMLALYRDARQSDALREFEQARQHLVDQLGVEPGTHLQRLHLAILRQQSDLEWVALPGPGTGDPSPSTSPSLPTPLSSLVGRQREVADVNDALGEHRLVTLVGPGGVGKTRVAVAVAHLLAATRPVWLVELASVTGASGVARQLAQATEVITHGDVVDAVAMRLGDRPAVVVFDTCEHVNAACAEIATRLLGACRGLAVLATGRQALGIDGEVAYPIRPLALPGTVSTFEQITGSDAVVLFRQRARAARADFELDATNAATVARVCSALDGLPLAIELAAARCNVLAVDSIVELLDDRFAFARRSGDTGERRQRSLEATIDWSHRLLDAEQQRALRRLGVLDGPFRVDLAVAVVGGDGGGRGLGVVLELVERSLALHDGAGEYRLLDSVRDYARRQLAEHAADADAAHGALAACLVDRCRRLEADLRGPGQHAAIVDLRALAPHGRVAMRWAIGAGRGDVAATLAVSFAWLWALDASNHEATEWLQAAAGLSGLDPAVGARVHETLGMHQLVTGDVGAAGRTLDRAIELWSAAGHPEHGSLAHNYAGVAETWLGHHDAAAAAQDLAIDLAERAGDRWMQAWARAWRARTALTQGDLALADRLLAEAGDLATAGDPRSLGWITSERAAVAVRRGDIDRALALADIAIADHERAGWAEGIVAALAVRGQVLVALERSDDALVGLRRALQIAAELSQPYVVVGMLDRTVDALVSARQAGLAARMIGHADAVIDRLGLPADSARRRPRPRATLAALADVLGAEEVTREVERGRRAVITELIGSLDEVIGRSRVGG